MNGFEKDAQTEQIMIKHDPSFEKLFRFGFSFEKGSIHTKRTMMLKELIDVFNFVQDPRAAPSEYHNAVYAENCTGKKTVTSRRYTSQYLRKLYILNPSFCIFRAMRFFWDRDVDGRKLTAFLCVFARDSILRKINDYVLGLPLNSIASKKDLHAYIDRIFPGRFSPLMTASLGRNLLSSWTQAGYLDGRSKKIRKSPKITPASVAFALFLGYLSGKRGEMLFSSRYSKILDYSIDLTINMAENASSRGWLVFKRVGDVMEVAFPNLLTSEEMEWVREQS